MEPLRLFDLVDYATSITLLRTICWQESIVASGKNSIPAILFVTLNRSVVHFFLCWDPVSVAVL